MREGPLPCASGPATLLDWDGRVGLFTSLGGLEYLVDLGGGQLARAATTALPAGSWHHVAAAFDGSRLLLLVDAKIVAARVAAGAIAGAAQGPLTLGASGSGLAGGQPFSGTLD